ncbi:MAG: UTP--glucose-1-phosphate uridylyltransferase GalU [Micrococcaceae bacterium]
MENKQNNPKITKAVIPAAGLGTRFLPATKAIPKEMLPVVDKPAIQYVVEEAVNAGCDDILMINGRNKGSLEDHFDHMPELEANLKEKGKDELLDKVNYSTELANIQYIRQGEPKGLGHAVLMAKSHIGNESFAVLLGDDLIDENDTLLKDMVAVAEKTGGSVIGLMEVAPEEISAYGCADVSDEDGLTRINTMVEKPDAKDAPSNLAVIGRYVLAPEVFSVLENTKPGKGNEIQLTDALNEMAGDKNSHGVYGVVFKGNRYDTGDKLEYIKAIVQLASNRDDLGPGLNPWLKEYASKLN